MRSHSSTRLLSRKARVASPLRARCAVAAIALLTSAMVAHAQLPAQQLTVAFTNAYPNGSLDSLTMPNSGSPTYSAAIAATNALFTGGTTQNFYTALVWVTNPATSTLDLIYADAEQHKIWRLPGPTYKTPTLIFSWSRKGSGPAYPVGLAADSAGNVYAISPSCAWDAPGVWVLPITTAGTYGAPLLIDKTFQDPTTHKPVSTLALTEVVVAGTGTAATPPPAGAWNALDLLVLVVDPLNTRVMRYSQSQIQSVLTPPSYTPLQGPTSTVVAPAQFSTQAILKIPPLAVGMDIEQDPNTGDMSLLFSTAGGRILDFDSVQNAFITPYAINLGLGLTRLRVGTYQNTPYVFVGQLGGQILEFAAPPKGSSNTTPFARVSKGVGNPTDLAVTTSGSTLAGSPGGPGSCINSLTGCTILPQLSLDITGPGISNIPPNAAIVADSCFFVDPRVTMSDGGPPSYLNEPLDIGDYCSNMPHVLLSNMMYGASGATGAALYAAKITASALNQYNSQTMTTPINNTLTTFIVDPLGALGTTTPQCGEANGPIAVWGPLPGIESNIPEGTTLIDISVACNSNADPPPAGKGNHPSILIEGAALVGLNAAYIDGEFASLQSAFNHIITPPVTPPATQILDTTPPTIVPAIQGYITNSLNYFSQGVAVAAAGGSALPYYNCALNTLAAGARYVQATDVSNPGVFPSGPAPSDDENPSGTLIIRFDNLYYEVNVFAGNAPIKTDALNPATVVPPCQTNTITTFSIVDASGNPPSASGPFYTDPYDNNDPELIDGSPGSPGGTPGPTYFLVWTTTGLEGTAPCNLSTSDGAWTGQAVPANSTFNTSSLYTLAYTYSDNSYNVTATLTCGAASSNFTYEVE